MTKETELLSKYIPEKAVNQIMKWVMDEKIHLKITNKRKTKLGDYRPPIRYPNHRITINHNLNKYSFLITLVHEIAHLFVWKQHKNNVAPHGKEWKTEYKKLMEKIISKDVFPDDLLPTLQKSIINSKASSNGEIELSRILKSYDEQTLGVNLEDITEGEIFRTENGATFKKGKKRRTRYLCTNIETNKLFLFHPLAHVEKI